MVFGLVYNSFSISPNDCVDFNNSFILGNFYSIDSFSVFYFSIEFDEEGYLRETNLNLTEDILCYLYFFYPIASVNLTNTDSPINITMGYYYYPISSSYSQSNIMSYDITEIHTVRNFIGYDDNFETTKRMET